MKFQMVVCSLLLPSLFACGGLKSGVGYVCKKCGEELVTLDGDTFRLQDTITPDLLIVCDYPGWDGHSYLMQKAHGGLFYMKLEADEMTSIDNTEAFVSVNGNEVYHVETDTKYKLPCSTSYMTYLGEWNNLQAFAAIDTICYSDGKYFAVKCDRLCKSEGTEPSVRMTDGARTICVTLGDLYNYKSGKTAAPIGVKRVEKDFYINPRNEHENAGVGFSVDLDVPCGHAMPDIAIREWMLDAIKNDVFSLLGRHKKFNARKEPSYDEFMKSLDDYGILWEKLCRDDYQVGDTLDVRLNGEVSARLIADTPNYATYRYWADLYMGGLHGMPRAYYITYDKQRQTILTAENTVKPSKLVQFRKEVMQSLKEWHDGLYDEDYSMEEFMQQAFSFHTPMIDEDIDDAWKSFLVHEYECDEWSGWESAITEEFSLENFPLPHLALLPEGVVVTYHPYQIDCFAAGEYYAVIPYSKANPCLSHSYTELPHLYPRLSDFIRP